MRVLHVMEATIGGTRRHLVDLALGQRSQGIDVAVAVATQRDPGFPADLDRLEAAGVDVRRVEMVREISPRRDWGHVKQLRALIEELRPLVVHTHSSKAGVLGRRAARRTARVHTPHTFAFLFGALFGRGKRALFRGIESYLGRSTDRLIAVSESEGHTIRRSGVVDAAKVRVVPNGIDPARVADAEALDVAGLGLDPGRPLAAVVGLVYAAKGQDLALAALQEPGLEDLQLVCVGPGELEELRGAAAAAGLGARVAVTGPRNDVPSVLAAADLLLLPSRWEGLPYVVLEAMAASLPVVATPVDGARDLVRDGVTGRLAETIDAGAIATALRDVVGASPEERLRMGAAGRERLDSDYTVERMVERTSAVYEEAVREARADGRLAS